MSPCYSRPVATIGLLVVLVTAPFATASFAASPRPSFLLVTIDTLRADRLGAYGYHRDTSPNLDAFAEESIVFERAYTTMATTLPAHASMMTGTYPIAHGVQANVAFLPRSLDDATSFRTLAEMLQDRGYETAAFVSAAPLKRHSGIDRGFETFSQPKTWQRNCSRTTEKALKWLEKRPKGPFFLWVHYFDPHWPYSPPKEYRNRFKDNDRLIEYLDDLGVADSRSAKILKINNNYDAEVRYTDDAVGRLFRRLKVEKLWDRTLVAVTSDHGEGLGQHDWIYHAKINNEQLHVPLMIKFPEQGSARRINRLTSLVDLLPILATVLPIGEKDRRQLQGVDVVSSEQPRIQAFSERVHRNSSAWDSGRQYALTTEHWKFFHSSQAGEILYDLRSDPYETRDVLEQYPEVAKELRERLFEHIQVHRSKLESKEAPIIDPETLEQLRALGYVD